MSFQAYLDNVEKQTGKTPNDFIALAKEKGFTQESKTGEIVSWLKQDYSLGHGHAMSMSHVIKNGAKISNKHVKSGTVHSDDSDVLRLDGITSKKA